MRISTYGYMAAGVVALTACSGESSQSDSTQPDTSGASAAITACESETITASGAWMRAARASQPTSAAFFTLCNGGEEDDALVAVSFAGANAAELHISTMDADSVASMKSTKKIALPAGEPAALKPGGAHVMLIGLTQAIETGSTQALRLEFEHADPIEITLEVRDATHPDPHSGH